MMDNNVLVCGRVFLEVSLQLFMMDNNVLVCGRVLLMTFDILFLIPCCASGLVFLPAVIKAMLPVLGIGYHLHGIIFYPDKVFLSLETSQQHQACNSK
jgi:hypothetical protein